MPDEGAALPAKRPRTQGKLRLKKRNRDALQMYMAGANLDAIAEHFGWKTRSSAQRAIKKALDEEVSLSPDELEQQRQLMLSQLNGLGRAHYLSAMRGDRGASDVFLRVLDRKAKLLGLDAPEKAGEIVGSALDAEIEALVASMQIGEAPAPPALAPAEEDA